MIDARDKFLMDQVTNWTTPIHQPDHVGLS